MTKALKNLKPNVEELSSKNLNRIYGGMEEQKVPGGDKGDPGYSSGNGEACCCACKCNQELQ